MSIIRHSLPLPASAGCSATDCCAFGIDSTPPVRDRVVELLEACGLVMVEQQTLGAETAGKQAWGGFVVATVPSYDT